MKIALVGYGRMGRVVEEVAEAGGHEVVARIDLDENPPDQQLTPEKLKGAEVAIEFTVPEAAVSNLERIAACGIDAVSGTTGWFDRLDEVRRTVEIAGTGLIYAPNFSLGVQVFFRLARLAAGLCDRLDEYDVYLTEAHHRHKLDHPSGTARQVAEMLLGEISSKERWELGTGQGALDPAALQVTSIRAGEIPGMHAVGLEGPDDRIEVRHEARGRRGLARGAVAAAEWVRGRKGVFTLDDMLADKWS